jgi:glutathione S-transferase
MSQFMSEKMIPHMAILENQLAKNDGVLVGKDVTWADIACYAFFSYVSMKHPDILKDCPNMSVLINKIASNDNIKKYLETRPTTEI